MIRVEKLLRMIAKWQMTVSIAVIRGTLYPMQLELPEKGIERQRGWEETSWEEKNSFILKKMITTHFLSLNKFQLQGGRVSKWKSARNELGIDWRTILLYFFLKKVSIALNAGKMIAATSVCPAISAQNCSRGGWSHVCRLLWALWTFHVRILTFSIFIVIFLIYKTF